MAEEKLDKPVVSKKERLIGILDRLKPDIYLMERLVGLIKKYHVLLSEPKLLLKYRKDWIALLMAFRLFEAYKLNQLNSEYIESGIKKIKAYDEGLAKDLRKILPFVKIDSNIFADLFEAYARGKDYLIAYISTHARELITRAKSIQDEKLSKKLVTLFSSISGQEVAYVITYKNDCESWVNVRYGVNYRINFFINRLNMYIKGGFEDNQQFMGLYKDFGDLDLTRTMLANNAVRNLWRFNEQLRYLNLLIELCKKSETSGEWKGFWGKRLIVDERATGNYGFWGEKGDKKGKNLDKHAELFETKYGNKDFAEILKVQKWKIGESPEGWGGEWKGNILVEYGFLQKELLLKLQNLNYQREKIIIPASLELHEILKKREDELIKGRNKSVIDLIAALSELTGVGLDKEKVIKKLSKLLEKRKWKLSKIAEQEKNELIAKATTALLDYDSFSKQQKIAMAKADLDFRVNRMKKLALSAITNSRYVIIKQRTDNFLRNLGELVRLDGASGAVAEASSEILDLLEFENLNENDFEEMEKLIQKGPDVVRNLRNFVGIYLKKEIGQKFIITIDDVEKLPIAIAKKILKPQQKYEPVRMAA